MTVIVWDGRLFATDKAASDGAAQWETTKAWRFNGEILSGAGPLQSILAMREWYKAGADPDTFPPEQLTQHWCHFVVIDLNGLRRYEQGPIPIEHGASKCAFGEGRDFAYGAMAMGASAYEAVEVTNKYSPNCGQGVEVYMI